MSTVERLTALFTDAILHAPIPDVNPNLIRTVESQARSCALAVIAESQAPAERLFYVDSWTGAPCPTRGNLLCAITDPDHRHRDGRSAQAPAEQEGWCVTHGSRWLLAERRCEAGDPWDDGKECRAGSAPSVRPATADDEGVRS